MDCRSQLTALLISPDRAISEQFRASIARTKAFHILAELNAYPAQSALDSKLRQLKPDVLLLDVATSLDTAGELIRFAAGMKPPVHVIGLHTSNDSNAILRSLRFGATEFLYAPFEVSIQAAAVARIEKLLAPSLGGQDERGNVVAFASAKPGSGASTLAMQTAYALRRATGKRVLLVDFDFQCGSLGFYLRLDYEYSVADLLRNQGKIDADLWSTVTADVDGIDVLPAPPLPYTDQLDGSNLLAILEYGRSHYPWIVLDLPCIGHRISLMGFSEADRAFLVSTPELASLHLTRRSVRLLNQLAFDASKFQVLVNRLEGRSEISSADMTKIFDCPVDKGLPNDRLAVQRVLTLGKPLEEDCDLARAVEGLAAKLRGAVPEKKSRAHVLPARPAMSEI